MASAHGTAQVSWRVQEADHHQDFRCPPPLTPRPPLQLAHHDPHPRPLPPPKRRSKELPRAPVPRPVRRPVRRRSPRHKHHNRHRLDVHVLHIQFKASSSEQRQGERGERGKWQGQRCGRKSNTRSSKVSCRGSFADYQGEFRAGV